MGDGWGLWNESITWMDGRELLRWTETDGWTHVCRCGFFFLLFYAFYFYFVSFRHVLFMKQRSFFIHLFLFSDMTYTLPLPWCFLIMNTFLTHLIYLLTPSFSSHVLWLTRQTLFLLLLLLFIVFDLLCSVLFYYYYRPNTKTDRIGSKQGGYGHRTGTWTLLVVKGWALFWFVISFCCSFKHHPGGLLLLKDFFTSLFIHCVIVVIYIALSCFVYVGVVLVFACIFDKNLNR